MEQYRCGTILIITLAILYEALRANVQFKQKLKLELQHFCWQLLFLLYFTILSVSACNIFGYIPSKLIIPRLGFR